MKINVYLTTTKKHFLESSVRVKTEKPDDSILDIPTPKSLGRSIRKIRFLMKIVGISVPPH